MNYWLFKSEPDSFSIDNLQAKNIEHWDGVRNYQARNMMRDQMRKGDLAFFYHSSCAQPAIVGIMRIAREAYPDHTAFDPESKYYDPKSAPEKPRWFMVDVEFLRKTRCKIPLQTLKTNVHLKDFALLRKGNRLSIMSVTAQEWETILSLE